jgi:hypothetical protein
MRKYEYFQWNWILIIALSLAVLVLSIKLNDPDQKPIPFLVAMMIQIILIVIPLMFYGLRTIINDREITLKYGIGIIQIKIDLAKVKSAQVVRNPWYYGIGIRLIPHGMLYNAHGLEAVELKIKNQKSIIRIGSGEPEILKYEIEKRIRA